MSGLVSEENTQTSHVVLTLDAIDSKSPDLNTHDVVASSSRSDLESTPESFPLKILPGHGPRPISRRDDSVSSVSSHLTSPAMSNMSLDQDHTHNSPAGVVDNDTRPRWLRRSNARGTQRINSILNTPGLSPIIRWLQGPSPPRTYKISPLAPKIQTVPITLLSSYLPSPLGAILTICFLIFFWLLLFSLVLSTTKASAIVQGDGQSTVRLDCITKLWPNASACGLDGKLCQPFEGSTFSFICPAGCADKQVLEPHAVGDQEINYRNFVIGGQRINNQGPPIYRGDSFICAAAVHAGIVSDTSGGSAILTREGTQSGFTSTINKGIESIAFEPSFPLSFSLTPSSENGSDPQWTLFGISLIITVLISLISTSPILFFTSTFTIVFFQVALASDAPYFPDFASVISLAFERFLPAAFVGVVLYTYVVRRTMTGLTAYLERTILWLGGCWVGALNVHTFDRIPISRLTPHDLKQQPGAILALIVIFTVIVLAGMGQIWVFRIEGRLLRYLGFYLVLGIIIACLIAIPGLDFRLHHYVIGLLLLPGTSIQTRPSLLYQGLLIGLFINGVARWGFASVLQTPGALREDGQLGSELPINLFPDITGDMIAFTITELARGFDGLSVLVNDVERFQQTNVSLPVVFNWTRTVVDETSFFRFAFTSTYILGGIQYGDYTKAGTWFGNGTWKDMLPGPSK